VLLSDDGDGAMAQLERNNPVVSSSKGEERERVVVGLECNFGDDSSSEDESSKNESIIVDEENVVLTSSSTDPHRVREKETSI